MQTRLPAYASVFASVVALAAVAHAETADAAGDAPPSNSRSTTQSARAASTLAERQRAAVRRLEVAARNLRRSVDAVARLPNDADFLAVTQAQFDRAELILAIRNARTVALGGLANRYRRILDAEVKRLNESRAFSALLRSANAYGQRVAQKAQDDNPDLPRAVLGNIAVNAASWYGNDALLKTTLRAAKRRKNSDVYEIALKQGEDLDRRAYGLYRALSVGSRKTTLRYSGREGLHRLPDANGGLNGGFIGFRRAAESASKSPAIDMNINGRAIKIHFRHGT